MSRRIEFFVPGVPVSQGSKSIGTTKTGRSYMREANATKLNAWRKTIAQHAETHRATWARSAALWVTMQFVLPAPKHTSFGWAPVTPDLDKLVRAVHDAIVHGRGMTDDAQVVALTALKFYGPEPGVHIRIDDAPDPYRARSAILTQPTKETPT